VHVGLNLVFLVPGETGGMEIAARETIRRLATTEGLRLTAFVNRLAAGEDWGPGVAEVVVPVDARDRRQWVWGEQRHLPRLAARAGCDLVHSLGSTSPLHGPFARVTTIHDLLYKVVPETHSGARGLAMRALIPASARRSHRLIVDAISTRDDLVRHLGVAPAKVDVVPLGVSPGPTVVPLAEAEVRERFRLGDRRVLLSVSARRPHKNLVRLIDAHAALDAADRPVLVLPGYPTRHEWELRDRASSADVVFPPWVTDEELEGLYAAADAFVFPSLYEGFGLPVLEAMARGVPVATSGRGALAEVAGDAALLFEPESVDDIRAALMRLLGDEALRERLRAAGRERAAAFPWERTAELTLAVYRRTLAAPR